MRCKMKDTSEKDIEVVDTNVHTLELRVPLDTESVGAKGSIN